MSPTEALSRGWAVWALATGVFFGYASLFFAFAALVLFWTADLGWSKSTLALGPMLSMLTGAAMAPLIGRFVDRGKGPELMVGGAVLTGLSLIGLSQVAEVWQWLLFWVLAGVGQIACQYEVSFAFLIRRLGPDAKRAIIRVTLVAGFSSLLSIPAYTLVAESLGWRAALLCAAAIMLVYVAPMNWLATRSIRRGAPPPQPRPPQRAGATPASLRRARALLALAFSLTSLSHWMVGHLLVPVFMAQGWSHGQAIFAAAIMGPAQVVGRFALMWFDNRINTSRASMIVMALMVGTTVLLLLGGIAYEVVIAYVLIQGAAIGIMTILRPVLIADVLGAESYGANAGVIQLYAMTAGALSPMIGSLLFENLGVNALILTSLGLAALAVAALGVLLRGQGRTG